MNKPTSSPTDHGEPDRLIQVPGSLEELLREQAERWRRRTNKPGGKRETGNSDP